jgi:hypothetical protein
MCPEAPPCTEAGCSLINISEDPCPVCVCKDTTLSAEPCERDEQCGGTYKHCINGRCGECRNDDDCENDIVHTCIQPGYCWIDTSAPLSKLYGTWLVGSSNDSSHRNFLRFEPDGTVRREQYGEDSLWTSSFMTMPCEPSSSSDSLMLGTWFLEPTDSSPLGVSFTLNLSCDEGEGARDLWYIDGFTEDGQIIFSDDYGIEAGRVDPTVCTPAFDMCESASL